MKYGNEIKAIEDGVEDISVNPIDFNDFSISNSINVIYTSNERKSRNVIWNEILDINKAQYDDIYNYNGTAGNIYIKCIFEPNTDTSNPGRRFVCNYYIGEKFLSPWKLKDMIKIRET